MVDRPCDRLAGVLEHWEQNGEAVANCAAPTRHVDDQAAAQHASNAPREDRRWRLRATEHANRFWNAGDLAFEERLRCIRCYITRRQSRATCCQDDVDTPRAFTE